MQLFMPRSLRQNVHVVVHIIDTCRGVSEHGIISRPNGVHLAPVQLNEMNNKFQFHSARTAAKWQQQTLQLN